MKIINKSEIPSEEEYGQNWVNYIAGDIAGWISLTREEIKDPKVFYKIILEMYDDPDMTLQEICNYYDMETTKLPRGKKYITVQCIGGDYISFICDNEIG